MKGLSISEKSLRAICNPLFTHFDTMIFHYTRKVSGNECVNIVVHTQDTMLAIEEEQQAFNACFFGQQGRIFTSVLNYPNKNFVQITLTLGSEQNREQFQFIIDPSHTKLNEDYARMLYRFLYYFKDASHKLFEEVLGKTQCIQAQIAIDNQLSAYRKKSNRRAYLVSTKIRRFFLLINGCEIYLTQREVECLHWYSEGKSANEVGMILGISNRTVEKNLDKIKQKLGVVKIVQAVRIFDASEIGRTFVGTSS